jgi:hypothetical protein
VVSQDRRQLEVESDEWVALETIELLHELSVLLPPDHVMLLAALWVNERHVVRD